MAESDSLYAELISIAKSDLLYADILVELECPICAHYMAPAIRLCETGHSICEPCMKQLPRCPLCQTNFTNAKNITLQALAQKVHYPCINQSFGCNKKLKLEERQQHEANCSFRSYKCAMNNCAWIGQLEDITNHWKSKSKIICSENNRFTTNITDDYLVRLAKAYDQLFWLKIKLENGIIYWTVQLIGPASKAANYYYEIDIYKSVNSKRRIILKDYCMSIEIDNNVLFEKDSCLTTISIDSLQYFIQNNYTLWYNVNIYELMEPDMLT